MALASFVGPSIGFDDEVDTAAEEAGTSERPFQVLITTAVGSYDSEARQQ